MLCLADGCLALEEDRYSLSFLYIEVHNSAHAVANAIPSLPFRAG